MAAKKKTTKESAPKAAKKTVSKAPAKKAVKKTAAKKTVAKKVAVKKAPVAKAAPTKRIESPVEKPVELKGFAKKQYQRLLDLRDGLLDAMYGVTHDT